MPGSGETVFGGARLHAAHARAEVKLRALGEQRQAQAAVGEERARARGLTRRRVLRQPRERRALRPEEGAQAHVVEVAAAEQQLACARMHARLSGCSINAVSACSCNRDSLLPDTGRKGHAGTARGFKQAGTGPLQQGVKNE